MALKGRSQQFIRHCQCSLNSILSLQSTAGSLQSLCWGSAAVGGIVSAYFSGSLVQVRHRLLPGAC